MVAYIVMVFMVISAIIYLKITAVAGCLSSIRDKMGYTLQHNSFMRIRGFNLQIQRNTYSQVNFCFAH